MEGLLHADLVFMIRRRDTVPRRHPLSIMLLAKSR
jgi:hypothetical protein